jgi:hypothetical protein
MPLGYEPEGRMFESCRAHHSNLTSSINYGHFYLGSIFDRVLINAPADLQTDVTIERPLPVSLTLAPLALAGIRQSPASRLGILR